MTDLPSNPDDLLISAYLDGTATPDERATVERDPVLRTRLDAFERVRELIAAPVVRPPTDALDALVATAMATNVGEQPGASDAEQPVASLTEARRRRSSTLWLSAAAVVLVFVLAVPIVVALVRHQGGGSSDVAASSAGPPNSAATEADAGSETAAPQVFGDGTSTTTTAAGSSASAGPTSGAAAAQVTAVDLGAAATDDELRLLVTDALTSPPATVSSGSSATVPGGGAAPTTTSGVGSTRSVDLASCEPVAQAAVPDAQTLRLSGTLTFAGDAAYGYVFATPSGFTAVVVSSDPARSCAILDQLAL